MTRILFLMPAAVLAISAWASEDWPQFRGPNGDGRSDSRDLPLTWSESENVKWKTPVHGKAWSSPVISGNQVWLTTATEDGRELFVVCVERGTGKVLRDEKMHPVELREMVTSPGGTTIRAIRELERAGVRAAFLNAIQAAMERSKELAEGES